MRIGYLDCFSGVAGDMWVGALLDLGLPLDDLRPAVASLGLSGVELRAHRVKRSSLASTRFEVVVGPPGGASHRHLPEILAILERADLPVQVKAHAVAVFQALGEVESGVHDQPIDQVHFHEVGAEDTIVDIVCACLGVHLLGLERLYSSAVTTGSGTVECAHGTLPVPAPAALANLLGVPVRTGGPAGERVTPTGAALLAVLVHEFEPELDWVPRATGLGAGSRDDPRRPNVLRVTTGELRDSGGDQQLWEVSCNLDTATGELLGYLLSALLEHGATDAFAQSIHMKKGRPGQMLTALVDIANRDAIVKLLLEESSTLGVRMHAVDRVVVERWTETLSTSLGAVHCKVWRLPSGAVRRRPEADDVARLARQHGLGRSEVLARLAPALDGAR